jgi:putative chitinase
MTDIVTWFNNIIHPVAAPVQAPAPAPDAAPVAVDAEPAPVADIAPAPAALGIPSLEAAILAAAPHIAPAKIDAWTAALDKAFAFYGSTSVNVVAGELGQFAQEAGSAFSEISENLNYTHASRLVAVFPSHFANEAAAAPYVGNPEKLANCVYSNRLGNGDEASGDGWRFAGKGLVQLTGRAEYTPFAASMGMTVEDAATYCTTVEGAAMSGVWYFTFRKLLPALEAWNLAAVTKGVNGSAMLGYAQRVAASNAAKAALS